MATFDFFKYFCSLVSDVPLQGSLAHYSPCHAGDRTRMRRSILWGRRRRDLSPLQPGSWLSHCYEGFSLNPSLTCQSSVAGRSQPLPSVTHSMASHGICKARDYELFYRLLEWHLIGHNIQKDRLESLVQHLVLIFIVPITFILPYRKLSLDGHISTKNGKKIRMSLAL